MHHLKVLGIPLLVLVITDEKAPQIPDEDAKQGRPENFHILRVGAIEEGLARL